MAKMKKKTVKPVKPEESLDDLMGQLSVGPKKAKKKKATKSRLVLDNLPEQTIDLVEEFCELSTAHKLVDAPFKQIKNEAKQAVWASFVDLWFTNQSKPANPNVEVKNDDGSIDSKCMLILSEKFHPQLNVSADDEGNAPSEEDLVEEAVDSLTNMGMDEDRARDFVSKELTLKPINGIYSFTHLSKGRKNGKDWEESSPEEKAVATKILRWLLGHEEESPTAEERALAIYVEPNISVEPGVFQRLHTYAEKSSDMSAMLSLLNPVYYLSRAEYAVGSTPVEKTNRIVSSFEELLGISEEE